MKPKPMNNLTPRNDAGRIIMRIEVYPHAKRIMEQTCQRLGMTQVAFASRVLEWFAGQEELLQPFVLDHVPEEIAPQVARVVLKKIAERK